MSFAVVLVIAASVASTVGVCSSSTGLTQAGPRNVGSWRSSCAGVLSRTRSWRSPLGLNCCGSRAAVAEEAGAGGALCGSR